MSVFDLFTSSDAQPARGDLVQQAQTDPNRFFGAMFGQYAKYKTLSELGDEVIDRVIPNKKKKLDRINAELDVRLKRQQLGLPWSDDVYEEATNDDKSFPQRAAAAFGSHVSRSIPEPGLLTPPRARGLLESSFPKTTKLADAGDYLLSSGMRAGGKGYAAGIGRFFGRL